LFSDEQQTINTDYDDRRIARIIGILPKKLSKVA
jgi:hypothetical protein